MKHRRFVRYLTSLTLNSNDTRDTETPSVEHQQHRAEWYVLFTRFSWSVNA